MTIHFTPVALSEVREVLTKHLAGLPSAIDSFLEHHIRESAHYRIFVSGEIAGFTAIHKGVLVTQFVLEPAFRRYGQDVYRAVRKLEQVQSAFVPTCDEFFLSHALDEYRQLAKQAYFFAAAPAPETAIAGNYTLRPAQIGDSETIQEGSGDFFADIEGHVQNGDLFLTLSEGVCVGFGIREKSAFRDDVASIGMFIIERFRQRGAGTATLRLLRAECERQNIHPIAGCWYYNHLSKKTLERARMYAQTRLLKVDY